MPGPSMPQTALLLQPNSMVAEALTARLHQHLGGVPVTSVASAAELTRQAAPRHDTLAVVALGAPGVETVAGLLSLHRARPQALLIATDCPDDDATAAIAALEGGVAAWLPRSAGGAVFDCALALALAGERFFPAILFARALDQASPAEAMARAAAYALETRLTERQRVVLKLLLRGRSNLQIARELGIAPITVKVHLQAIFARLGVSNRTQAAVLASRARWFENK